MRPALVAAGVGVAVALALGAAPALGDGAFAAPAATRSTPGESSALRVTEVLGATSDAYEAVPVAKDLWVATSGGLVVVRDGKTVRVLGPSDGLPGTRLRSLTVLPEGVWAGGVDGAALVAPGERGEPRVVRVVPLRRVRRVAAWEGVRYFATFGGGLVREDGTPLVTELGSGAAVTDLVALADGLYVATAGAGVLRLDAKGRVSRRWRKSNGLASDVVWDLEPAPGGALAATSAGLSLLGAAGNASDAPQAGANRALPVKDIRALARGSDGLLAATNGGGIWRLQGATWQAAGGPVFARSVVENGAGWVASSAEGVVAARDAGGSAWVVAGGLPSADVSALAIGADGLWVGTFEAGLAHVDARGTARPMARDAVDRRINDLAVLREPGGPETLYVATDAGLFAGRGSSFLKVEVAGAPPREHLSALYVDAGTGDLWAGGAHGLSRLHAGAWTRWASATGGLRDQIDAVTVDARGQVWVGSLHGLLRFDAESGRADVHDVASGVVPIDWVTACIGWSDGIAVGTYNGGLSFVTSSGPRWIGEADGLPSGWVNAHAMRAVGGQMWFGALDRGLIAGRPGAWTQLGLEAGLPSADVTAIAPDGSGGAWVGTRGGVAHVEAR